MQAAAKCCKRGHTSQLTLPGSAAQVAPAGLSAGNAASLGALCTAVWVALFAVKAALGFSLRGIALHFLQRHAKT